MTSGDGSTKDTTTSSSSSSSSSGRPVSSVGPPRNQRRPARARALPGARLCSLASTGAVAVAVEAAAWAQEGRRSRRSRSRSNSSNHNAAAAAATTTAEHAGGDAVSGALRADGPDHAPGPVPRAPPRPAARAALRRPAAVRGAHGPRLAAERRAPRGRARRLPVQLLREVPVCSPTSSMSFDEKKRRRCGRFEQWGQPARPRPRRRRRLLAVGDPGKRSLWMPSLEPTAALRPAVAAGSGILPRGRWGPCGVAARPSDRCHGGGRRRLVWLLRVG